MASRKGNGFNKTKMDTLSIGLGVATVCLLLAIVVLGILFYTRKASTVKCEYGELMRKNSKLALAQVGKEVPVQTRVSAASPALVNIWLPCYTAIEMPWADAFQANVLAFIAAFNAKYETIGVSIVGYMPTYVAAVGGMALGYSKFVELSKLVLQTCGDKLELGLTLVAPFVSKSVQPITNYTAAIQEITAINSVCKKKNTTLYTYLNQDLESIAYGGYTNPYDNETSVAYVAFLNAFLPLLTAQQDIKTIIITGGWNSAIYSNLKQANSNGFNVVGIPEIYDMEGSCPFPPVFCPQTACPATAQCGCGTQKLSSQDLLAGVETWFPSAGGKSACWGAADITNIFSNANTWPAFSLQAPCNDAVAGNSLYSILCPTCSNTNGVGCSNFSSATLDNFVKSFLLPYGAAITKQTTGPTYPVTVTLYDACYLPAAWFAELGLTVTTA